MIVGNSMKMIGKAEDATALYFEAYEKYKDNFYPISGRGLYNYIEIKYAYGACDKVETYVPIYLANENFNNNLHHNLNHLLTKCKEIREKQEKCKLFYGTGDRGKLDVVFVGDGYTDMKKFEEDVKLSVDEGIFGYKFMKDQKDKFNIYLVNEQAGGMCKGDVSWPMCNCKYSEIWKVASVCPTDRVVVLSRENFRSCANFGTVAYNSFTKSKSKKDKARLILHETGHSFYSLVDEYIEESVGDKPGAPNCFNSKSEAENYWVNTLGLEKDVDFKFYTGCSYVGDNVRGTKCTVMGGESCGHDDKKEYGKINEAHISDFMGGYS